MDTPQATTPPTDATVRRVHPFTKRGLGEAPFVFLGYEYKTFKAAPDAPTQPGSTCDYCGSPIMNVYNIQSADGKKHKVGPDCIRKTEDFKLVAEVETVEAKARKVKAREKHLRNLAEWAAIWPTVKPILAAIPHPNEWRRSLGETMADSFEYAFDRSGMAGTAKVLKRIKEIQKKGAL